MLLRLVPLLLCGVAAASILNDAAGSIAGEHEDDGHESESSSSHGKGHGKEHKHKHKPTTKGPTTTITSSTSTTVTTSTSTTFTTTSTTGPHVVGGPLTDEAFKGWLAIWRSKYKTGLWNAGVSDPWESMLPKALKGVKPIVVESEGGVAAGIVTEGMGYGMMIEGMQAAKGSKDALEKGLALTKSWLALVAGPGGKDVPTPYAGGADYNGSATKVDFWPYGVSAIEWSHEKLGATGLPAWKFPIDLCEKGEDGVCTGSATDGDQDALMGMIYLAGALGYPSDFVDMAMRTVISFASADMGFPDLYRTLPGGEVVYVPKLGSMWGGLLPPGGKYKTKQQAWCYSPGYFAPAHYRTFRDFAAKHWRPAFNDYLPKHLNGEPSTLNELTSAFDSAVTGGYNILYYSSCSSGSVSNWVGVEAACQDNDTLHCDGVPWAHTPWVGPNGGTCEQSGTKFGSYGADASRAAWRIAMDYSLYREESSNVIMYDREGFEDFTVTFSAREYLNRIAKQYKNYASCDGGTPGDCMHWSTSPYQLAHAWDTKHYDPPNVNCTNVPNPPESWWAGFMAYPTFAAFVAPYDEIPAANMTQWMETLVSICNFSAVNFSDYKAGGEPIGKICLTSYFEASQAVISTMIMSGSIGAVIPKGELVVLKADASYSTIKEGLPRTQVALRVGGLLAAGMFCAAVISPGLRWWSSGRPSRALRLRPRASASPYAELHEGLHTADDAMEGVEVADAI